MAPPNKSENKMLGGKFAALNLIDSDLDTCWKHQRDVTVSSPRNASRYKEGALGHKRHPISL